MSGSVSIPDFDRENHRNVKGFESQEVRELGLLQNAPIRLTLEAEKVIEKDGRHENKEVTSSEITILKISPVKLFSESPGK